MPTSWIIHQHDLSPFCLEFRKVVSMQQQTAILLCTPDPMHRRAAAAHVHAHRAQLRIRYIPRFRWREESAAFIAGGTIIHVLLRIIARKSLAGPFVPLHAGKVCGIPGRMC